MQAAATLPVMNIAANEICAFTRFSPVVLSAELADGVGVVSVTQDDATLIHLGIRGYLDRRFKETCRIRESRHNYFIQLALENNLPMIAPAGKGSYLDVMLFCLRRQVDPLVTVIASQKTWFDCKLLSAIDVVENLEKWGIAAAFKKGTKIKVMPQRGDDVLLHDA